MKRFFKKHYPYSYKLEKTRRRFFKKFKEGGKEYLIESALERFWHLRCVGLDNTVAAWAAWWGCALDKHGYETVDEFVYWHLTQRA